jgi:CheY-like chemotaxis protein
MPAERLGSDILIVDDNCYLRDFMRRFLEEEGYAVRCACNGREALDYLRSAPEPPALIFLDLTMPVMDGRQFRAAQLRDRTYTSVPLVVVSSDGDSEEAAASLGAAGCLMKPFTLDKLIQVVSEHFRAPARGSAAT